MNKKELEAKITRLQRSLERECRKNDSLERLILMMRQRERARACKDLQSFIACSYA